MNFGFNSNVRVGNAVYHVQTEDRGPAHPFLDTVVYLAGRVIYKRSKSYEKAVGGVYADALADMLHEMLALQHNEVIAELESGALTLESAQQPAKAAQTAAATQTFVLNLLNPKDWFAAGNVVFEMEVVDQESNQRVAGALVHAFLEHEQTRVSCAEAHTDADGRATLKFPMPGDIKDGSSMVIDAAMDAAVGAGRGELRFRLKPKVREQASPAVNP